MISKLVGIDAVSTTSSDSSEVFPVSTENTFIGNTAIITKTKTTRTISKFESLIPCLLSKETLVLSTKDTFAFGLERNQQSEDEDVRHTTTLRCLKDRYTGLATGKTICIKYEKDTGLLKEVSETFKEKTEQNDEDLF